MQNKKLGYDKDHVLYLPDAYLLGSKQDAFKEDLIRDGRVISASIARSVPGSVNIDGTEIFPKNENGNGAEIHSNIYHIDYDFLHTLNIPVAQGRNFSKEFPTDSSAVLINEAAVRQLGWSRLNPLGRSIVRSGQNEYKVVGVVADFHYASLKQKIAPLMMLLGKNYGGLIIKLKTGDIKLYIDDLKRKWNSFHPDGAFTYQFLDENFASLYAAEQSTGQIFTSFTIVAILIASLGLFGLAAFVTEQRTKEIGIRKVLGASVRQLLILVTKDFLYLVGAAFILSIPLSWWVMNDWLQYFAYRIKINMWVFPIAGMSAVLIALLTISFRAIKASMANPVTSLKTE
jgi:putative ABC transport system permease protein